jgi:glutamine amidotransferase-like uncharacterized protein
MRRLQCLLWFGLVFASSCTASEHTAQGILLFSGRGTSSNDVAAIEGILRERGLPYSTASSAQLDVMSGSELKTYRLLVMPGGNFIDIGNGLTTSTTAKLRRAVESGLGYFSVCAGAFFAGASPYNGLKLTDGVRFSFYTLENHGIRKAPVTVHTAASASIEVYWEDGPQLVGWGEPIARYPDGTPAVVQGKYGNGWVVLTGVHPEAPESWRRGLAFTAPPGPSLGFAATLIDAALNAKPLPHD